MVFATLSDALLGDWYRAHFSPNLVVSYPGAILLCGLVLFLGGLFGVYRGIVALRGVYTLAQLRGVDALSRRDKRIVIASLLLSLFGILFLPGAFFLSYLNTYPR